jgi:hypothetical protein
MLGQYLDSVYGTQEPGLAGALSARILKILGVGFDGLAERIVLSKASSSNRSPLAKFSLKRQSSSSTSAPISTRRVYRRKTRASGTVENSAENSYWIYIQ